MFAFLTWQLAWHLVVLWKLALRKEAFRLEPTQISQVLCSKCSVSSAIQNFPPSLRESQSNINSLFFFGGLLDCLSHIFFLLFTSCRTFTKSSVRLCHLEMMRKLHPWYINNNGCLNKTEPKVIPIDKDNTEGEKSHDILPLNKEYKWTGSAEGGRISHYQGEACYWLFQTKHSTLKWCAQKQHSNRCTKVIKLKCLWSSIIL